MPEVEENDAKSYELAFEEAGRALDARERAVNELRSRSGVLIAAAAITTSFFGARAITASCHGHPHPDREIEFPLVQRDVGLHRSVAYDANATRPMQGETRGGN